MNRIALLAFVVTGMGAPVARAQSSDYHIAATYTLGGAGGWDYVVPDPASNRVYIGRSDRVMVVDERDGKLIGEVTDIHGAHGTAIVPKTGHGFATSGNDSSVVMFDLKTLKVLRRIPAAADADAVIFDPVSNRVFSLNGDAHSTSVVDPRKGTLIRNVDLGGKPEYAVSGGNGKVYTNLTDVSEIVEVDARRLNVTKRWPTAPCKNPVSLAIDTRLHRLFSGCRSGVMAVSDYRTGTVVATVPIGAGVDGAGFDPVSRNAFASNGDGTLTVIHQTGANSYSVIQNLVTAPGSRNMGLDPVTHRIYLPSAKFGPRPDSSATNPRRRAPMVPGSFAIIVVEQGK